MKLSASFTDKKRFLFKFISKKKKLKVTVQKPGIFKINRKTRVLILKKKKPLHL